MNPLYLIIGALALVYLSKAKKAAPGRAAHNPAAGIGGKPAVVQTSPSSRNTNQGIGNAPNSKNNPISDAVNDVTNGINAITGIYQNVAGLGKGSTPGKTVGVTATKAPATGTGNDSFDAQDAIAAISGSDMAEYADNFMFDDYSEGAPTESETPTDVPASGD